MNVQVVAKIDGEMVDCVVSGERGPWVMVTFLTADGRESKIVHMNQIKVVKNPCKG